MHKARILAAGGLGIVTLLSVQKPAPRLVWNASASVPIGLYWLEPSRPVTRGDLVLATLPEAVRTLAARRHYLPASVPVLKPVAALAGDRICGVGADILIDGRVAARRLPADRRGRPLPAWQGCHVLLGDELFLLSGGVPDSFDGRYFGPIETGRVVGRAVPLWTR